MHIGDSFLPIHFFNSFFISQLQTVFATPKKWGRSLWCIGHTYLRLGISNVCADLSLGQYIFGHTCIWYHYPYQIGWVLGDFHPQGHHGDSNCYIGNRHRFFAMHHPVLAADRCMSPLNSRTWAMRWSQLSTTDHFHCHSFIMFLQIKPCRFRAGCDCGRQWCSFEMVGRHFVASIHWYWSQQ
jgi:hypothetical protein